MEDATSDLARFRSQNSHHLGTRSGSPVDIENFTKLQIDLVDQQRQLRELQEFMDNKENEKSRNIRGLYNTNQNHLTDDQYALLFVWNCKNVDNLDSLKIMLSFHMNDQQKSDSKTLMVWKWG